MNKERRKELRKAINALMELSPKWDEIKGIVETAAAEEREYYDNMGDNLKGGDKGQQADNAATQLEEVKSAMEDCDLDDLVAKLEDAEQ
jgi:hypothetical protein